MTSLSQKSVEERVSALLLPQKVIDNLMNELKDKKVSKKQMDLIVERVL